MICPLKKSLIKFDYQDYKEARASRHSKGASSQRYGIRTHRTEDFETPRASRDLDSPGFQTASRSPAICQTNDPNRGMGIWNLALTAESNFRDLKTRLKIKSSKLLHANEF